MTPRASMLKNTAILTIGEVSDFDSFRKIDMEKHYIKRTGFDYKAIDYDHISREKELGLASNNVIIFPFFPFKHWNKYIETQKYRGLYGNISFRDKFLKFCDTIEKGIDKMLPGKKCFYVNDLKKCAYFRDKKTLMKKLENSGVDVPRRVGIKSPEFLKRELLNGHKFFVKPRCGSMGKGITYLEKDNWQTNFNVRKNKVKNRYSDYGWSFKNVTNNSLFLKDLLRRDLLMEEAIESLCLGKHKVDFRVYVFHGKVIYIYPRINTADSVTTNISQGGKGRPGVMKKVPESVVRKIKRQAAKTAKVLDLGFIGVDVVVDKAMKKAYIVDVNMFPGLPRRRTHNLSRTIINELAKRY